MAAALTLLRQGASVLIAEPGRARRGWKLGESLSLRPGPCWKAWACWTA